MKNKMLFLKISVFLLMTSLSVNCQKESISSEMIAPHPRLLLLKGEETKINETIAADNTWKVIHQFILNESGKLETKPPVERVLIGRRLLDKSREALRRIFYLSYAYRMTSDKQYLDRAEKEMLAVCAFSDWNPSHFLDVAEMTMAVSIGYDWLYDKLSPDSREIIRTAIIEKGLKPSLDSKYNSWLKASHNWNQVCNAGMTYGALAVFEDDKDLAVNIIDRAISSIKLPMEGYEPDGAYSEGYGYWGYGTSFNIMFLSAMEKAFGNDYKEEINPAFFKTAGYLENMTGPTGNCFNYSDCGAGGGLEPAMFWFANRLNDPSLLWSERYNLLNKKIPNDRLLPAIMVWSAGLPINKIVAPSSRIWVGQGKNPVALMRSSWNDPQAIYIGLKGGSPSVNHGHMDIGSFVMDAMGERWAMDFGPQNYNSLESAGVNLWSMTQTSQRWEVFRYNNFVHNTLTVNGQLQTVSGYAPITGYSDQPDMLNAVTDISSLYKGLLKKSVRGIAIVDNQYVMVRDEVEISGSPATIRWTLLTSADVTVTGNNTAELSKNGKKLIIKVVSPSAVTMKTWSTTPPHSYDEANPGTTLVGFETSSQANSSSAITVLLMPEGAVEKPGLASKSLSEWPKKPAR